MSALLRKKAKNLLIFLVVVILVLFYVLQNTNDTNGNIRLKVVDDNQPLVQAQDDLKADSNDEPKEQEQHESKDESKDQPKDEDEPIQRILENSSINLLHTIVQTPIRKVTQPNQPAQSAKTVFHFHGNDGYTGNFKQVCPNNVDLEPSDATGADILYYLMNVPKRNRAQDSKRKYVLVYAMESEPHSGGAETWRDADFRMWYNLDKSYPEPATYFDVRHFLGSLLAPPRVKFEDKETSAPLVWILSNCHAFNARQVFVGKLMKLIGVDSYGGCLRNKNTHTSVRMHGNIELYAKYKFVISIENSNCEDYVTEKLVHAVGSGSIPIVAGKDGKPDYLKFMPKGSYINIYDFKSVEELVKHLELVGSNKEEYEKYMKFRLGHNYTRDYLNSMGLQEVINIAKTIIDPSEKFFSELVAKEKSENKLCKIARYIKSKPADVLDAEIEAKRANRPSIPEACLKSNNLADDF